MQTATLGGLIKDHRLKKRLSQLEVSLRIGWSDATRLSKIEQGRVGRPSRKTLEKIMDALELDVQQRGEMLRVGTRIPEEQETKQVLKKLVEEISHVKYPVLIVDTFWTTYFVNDQFIKLFELSPKCVSEIKKKHPNWLELIFLTDFINSDMIKAGNSEKQIIENYKIYQVNQFKYEMQDYLTESWLINLVRKLSSNDEFKKIWNESTKYKDNKYMWYDYEFYTFDKNNKKLSFHVCTMRPALDPRFNYIIHFPADGDINTIVKLRLNQTSETDINFYQKICIVYLFGLLLLWVTLNFLGLKEGFYNYLYSFLFGLIPFFGGGYAILKSNIWGGLKSSVGKAVFFIGLGLLCWGFGETIWSYYNFFLGEPAPYPSLADLGFAPSIFFYGLGAMYLAKATGAKYGLRNKIAKAFVILAPVVILIMSYYLLVVIARGGVLVPEGEPLLKAILDIAYPLGDLLGLIVAVIISGLSFKYLGGRYLIDIYSILLGLAVMYIADTVFSYTTTTGTFYNGSFGDLLLTLGLFFLTFGVLGFCSIYKKK